MDPYRNPLDEDQDVRPNFNRAHYAQRTSALAILSVIAGLMSFPMMCCLVMSIPFSVFAIVCGHMSRGIIRSTRGEYTGIEMATFGMLMGYVTLLIMGSLLTYFSLVEVKPENSNKPAVQQTASDVLLTQAENQLIRGDVAAIGSSTTNRDATPLAQHFVDTLKELDRTHFAESDPEDADSNRQYRVFTQLNPDGVAFLVSVPDLNRFTSEAGLTLTERCWIIAQRSTEDLLSEGDRLAVALYGADGEPIILTGKIDHRGTDDAGLNRTANRRKHLAAFFKLDRRSKKPTTTTTNSRVERKAEQDVTLPAEIE